MSRKRCHEGDTEDESSGEESYDALLGPLDDLLDAISEKGEHVDIPSVLRELTELIQTDLKLNSLGNKTFKLLETTVLQNSPEDGEHQPMIQTQPYSPEE